MEKGLLVVLSGPSGAGKGTVLREVLNRNENVCVSISCTTRKPRRGETDGIHYYFKSHEEFKDMLKQGEFLEYAQVYDEMYGTPLFAVNEKREQGKDVGLEIDVQGALEVRKKVEDAILIFVMPPSMEELKHRLAGRDTETEEQIENRFTAAYNEIKMRDHYDYIIVNNDIDDAADSFLEIIEKERAKRKGGQD